MSTITEEGVYYYGHGQAWLGVRTTGGLVDNFDVSLPEIDALSISLTKESIEHVSKRDSIAFKDLKVTRMVSGTGKITCAQHTADLLKTYLYGTKTAIAGGSVTAVAFENTTIAAGETVPFPGDRVNLSTFTSIVDSAGSPITLVNGTDYLVDEKAGVVKFINIPGTQPYKLNGTEAAGNGVGIFMQRTLLKWLRAKVIDIAANDEVKVIDLYKIDIEPASEWALFNDGGDVNKYEISFELLKDTTKSSSATFGQFGRYRE
jgi:hypothetical protein